MVEELNKAELKRLSVQFNNNVEKISDVLSEQIDVYYEAANTLNQKYKLNSTPPLINNFIFFRISFRDIINATKHLINATTEADINLHSRTLALHLYEFLMDANDLLGSKFKKSLAIFPDSTFLTKEFIRLKTYQKAQNTLLVGNLRLIRHNTIGHKHQEGVVLNTIIKNIKSNDITGYSILIWVFCMQIINFQNNLLHSLLMVSENNLSNSPKNTEELSQAIALTRNKIEVDGEWRRFMLIIKGVDAEMATLFCTMTFEEREAMKMKLLELQNYLETKKDNSDLRKKIKIIQNVSPELLGVLFKFTPEKIEELKVLKSRIDNATPEELNGTYSPILTHPFIATIFKVYKKIGEIFF